MVLKEFIGISKALGTTELAAKLGMTKNMVHRALTTLEEFGYVVRDASGRRFEIGPGVLKFLDGAVEQTDVRAIAHPYLQRLQEATGESVFFSIIVGRSRVNVDSVEAGGRRVTYGLRGRAVPLHLTITSRMLLAHLTDDEIHYYLNTITAHANGVDADPFDPQQLWEELARFRQLGWGVDSAHGSLSHLNANYACFALVDAAGRPHGVISVGGPQERFSTSRIENLLPTMQEILLGLQDTVKLFSAQPILLHRI